MPLPLREAPLPTDASLSLQFDERDPDLLASAFRTPGDGPRAWWLNGEAHRISLIEGFDRLLARPSLRGVARYPHQERTCVRVLREMRGRAILADEVGLGKTIEAGLILKEYAIRGLVRRALILTPASLTGQWREEMESKFALPFAVLRMLRDWEREPLLIASMDTAKRAPHRLAAQGRPWDLVIVDEAHRLKNRFSLNWRFVAGLSKKYMLLLTATPVQNDLDELFNLVSLLKPGQLHSYDRFVERYVGSADRRVPARVPELRDRLRDVMVRHRRGGEEEHVPLRKARDEPPVQAGSVLQSVGLVHDHKVPRSSLGREAMGCSLRRVHRGDEERLPLPITERPEDRKRQGELRFHLLPPLACQGSRRQD